MSASLAEKSAGHLWANLWLRRLDAELASFLLHCSGNPMAAMDTRHERWQESRQVMLQTEASLRRPAKPKPPKPVLVQQVKLLHQI